MKRYPLDCSRSEETTALAKMCFFVSEKTMKCGFSYENADSTNYPLSILFSNSLTLLGH